MPKIISSEAIPKQPSKILEGNLDKISLAKSKILEIVSIFITVVGAAGKRSQTTSA
jgi:hypothetical protein